jgi:WD40 repeat protein
VGLAAAKIEDNSFDTARDLLNSTNPRFRNWEWGYLMHLCEGYVTNFNSTQRLDCVALIGDGPEFVVAGEEGLAEIRSTADPDAVVKKLPLSSNLTVFDVAVSPNGRWIALATNDTNDGFIKIWDRTTSQWADTTFGTKNASFNSREDYEDKHKTSHMDPVVSVQFSRDGTKLLTASLDRTARVWDASSGKQLARLFGTNSPGHTGFVWDAVFCPKFENDADGKPDLAKPIADGGQTFFRKRNANGAILALACHRWITDVVVTSFLCLQFLQDGICNQGNRLNKNSL